MNPTVFLRTGHRFAVYWKGVVMAIDDLDKMFDMGEEIKDLESRLKAALAVVDAARELVSKVKSWDQIDCPECGEVCACLSEAFDDCSDGETQEIECGHCSHRFLIQLRVAYAICLVKELGL